MSPDNSYYLRCQVIKTRTEQTALVRKSSQVYQYHALHHVAPHRMQQEVQSRMAQHRAQVLYQERGQRPFKSEVEHPSELQRDQDCCSQDQGHKEDPAGTQGIGSRPIIRHRRRRGRMLLHLRSRGRWFCNGSCKGIHSSLTSAHQVRPTIQERYSGLAVFSRPKWNAQVNKIEGAAAT